MKDIFTSYVAQFTTMLSNFVVSALMARLLLPEGRGELGQVMLWPTLIAAMTAFNLSDSIVFFMASKREDPSRVMGSAFTLGLVASLASCAFGFFVALPLLESHLGPEARIAGYVYLLYVPLGYWGSFVVAAFAGQMRFDIWNALRALVSVSLAIYGVLLWLTGEATVLGFAAAALASNLTVLILGAVLLTKRGWLGIAPARPVMTGMFLYGIKLHIGELLALANQRIDQILITQWLPTSAYGYYLVALGVSGSATSLIGLLGQLVFPKVAAAPDAAARAETLGRYMRLAVVLAVVGSISLYLLARWLVILVYGQHFAPAVTSLQIFAFGMGPIACRILLAQTFKACGRPKLIILAELIAFAANAVLLAILIPRFGIVGAAISLVVSQTISCIVLVVAVRARLGMALLPLFSPSTVDVRFVVGWLRTLMG